MKYRKPEVLSLESAASAIQSMAKGPHTTIDNAPMMPATFDSPPAYEADE